MTTEKNGSEITINGAVSAVSEFHTVRGLIDDTIKEHPQGITLNMLNSDVIKSSLVGHLLKVIKKDGVDVKINAESDELISLFEKMGLSDVFKVKNI